VNHLASEFQGQHTQPNRFVVTRKTGRDPERSVLRVAHVSPRVDPERERPERIVLVAKEQVQFHTQYNIAGCRDFPADQGDIKTCHRLNLPGPDAEQVLLAQPRLHQSADLTKSHCEHIDPPRSLAITDPLIAEVPIERLVDD
jgi:hypothetical protein